MRKLFFVVVLMFVSICSMQAQKLNLESVYGETFTENSRLSIPVKSFIINEYTYVLRRVRVGSTYDYYIDKFNIKMRREASRKIDLSQGDKEKEFAFLLPFNKKIYLYSYFENQAKMQKFLFCQTLDEKTLYINDDIIKISQTDYTKRTKYNTGFFGYAFSQDSSKLMIISVGAYDINKSEIFSMVVFDEKMNEVWSTKDTVLRSDVSYYLTNWRLANNGEVYLVGKLYEKKLYNKTRSYEDDYDFIIYRFFERGTETSSYQLKGDEIITSDLYFTIKENGSLLCAWFNEKSNSSSKTGVQTLMLDNKLQNVMHTCKLPFSAALNKQGRAYVEKPRILRSVPKDLVIKNFDDLKLLKASDGSCYLIAEIRLVEASGSIIKQYFEDVYVVKISTGGEIDWIRIAPKKQAPHPKWSEHASFVAGVFGTDLYLVYNDSPSNKNYRKGGKVYETKPGRESDLVVVKFDNTGKYYREVFANSTDFGNVVVPYRSIQYSDNSLLLYVKDHGEYGFIRLIHKK